jgi:hypothetical protein
MPYSISKKEKIHKKSSLCVKSWHIAIEGGVEQGDTSDNAKETLDFCHGVLIWAYKVGIKRKDQYII